jgi:hypothetical protein
MKSIIIGAILSVYFYFVYLFYNQEGTALVNAYLKQRDLHFARNQAFTTPEVEVAAILGFVAFMALGYIGGIKKAVFTLFLYKVPYTML